MRLYDSLMNDREIKNREWNWKSGGIFIFQNRLDSIPSFISTLFDSWKDYEYRRRQNYFLMVFFMTVSQPAMFKRNAKGERTMAHIYFVNISKLLSWMIYVSRFVSLFETSRFLSSRFYQALFRERRWIDLKWLIRKKDWRKRKSASVLRCWKELRNSYSEIILASLSKLSKRWSNESN